MISALSHFLYLPNRGVLGAWILGPECPRIDGDPDSRMGGGPLVCIKSQMRGPASFLRKLHGVVGGGLRAQVKTLEWAKAVWQSSRHCSSLVEAGVNRKTPAMAAQGTQETQRHTRRHSQRQRWGRLGRASWGRVPEAAPAGKGQFQQRQQNVEREVQDFCF